MVGTKTETMDADNLLSTPHYAGFMNKCAEYGIDHALAKSMYKTAGLGRFLAKGLLGAAATGGIYYGLSGKDKDNSFYDSAINSALNGVSAREGLQLDPENKPGTLLGRLWRKLTLRPEDYAVAQSDLAKKDIALARQRKKRYDDFMSSMNSLVSGSNKPATSGAPTSGTSGADVDGLTAGETGGRRWYKFHGRRVWEGAPGKNAYTVDPYTGRVTELGTDYDTLYNDLYVGFSPKRN